MAVSLLPVGADHGQSIPRAATPDPAPVSQSRPWKFEIVDGGNSATAARIVAYSPEERRFLVPTGALSWIALNQPGRRRGDEYFYADGAFTLETSADRLQLCVRKGLEYAVYEREVARADADAAGADKPTTIQLEHVFDMNARGFYSGDGHIHPASGTPDWAQLPPHSGRKSFHDAAEMTNQLLWTITRAEDLNYANLLASNAEDDTVHFGHRITGRPEPESDARHCMRVSEEYRSGVLGHLVVFGVRELSDPVFSAEPGGTAQTHDFPTNHEACLKYAAQGAFPSIAHPRRQKNLALETPVDVALGSLRAIEIQGYTVAPLNAADLWEKLMGCGFDMVLTAGTDSTLSFVKCLPPGGARVYVDLDGHPFSDERWVSQLAKGRAFTTNGAMLFLTVDGRKPGETIALEHAGLRAAEVRITVESLFPWETVTLRMNGRDALAFRSADDNPLRQEFTGAVDLTEPAWIYAHVAGPISDHVHQGINPWWEPTHDAYTNAVWVTTPGQLRRRAEDCQFMIDWINDNLAALEQRNNYGSAKNRKEVRTTFMRALAVFEQRKAEAGPDGGEK